MSVRPPPTRSVSTERLASLERAPGVRARLRQLYRGLFPEGCGAWPIAKAVFLGVFIGILPTLGLALVFTAAAAALCRVPKGPALVASFVATPPTLFAFFYPLGYVVGCELTAVPPLRAQHFLDPIASLNLLNAGEVLGKLWLESRPHLLAWIAGMPLVAGVTAVLFAAIAYAVVTHRDKSRR